MCCRHWVVCGVDVSVHQISLCTRVALCALLLWGSSPGFELSFLPSQRRGALLGKAGGLEEFVAFSCSHFAASESMLARGKVKLFLQVCATNAGDNEAKAGVGDEAEQDTNDKGECQSKLLSDSFWPKNVWFTSMLLCMLNFNSL